MKKCLFEGIATALATPFDENGVNTKEFEKFINFQIDSGINALVVCGTTGEASTMTQEEKGMVQKLYDAGRKMALERHLDFPSAWAIGYAVGYLLGQSKALRKPLTKIEAARMVCEALKIEMSGAEFYFGGDMARDIFGDDTELDWGPDVGEEVIPE